MFFRSKSAILKKKVFAHTGNSVFWSVSCNLCFISAAPNLLRTICCNTGSKIYLFAIIFPSKTLCPPDRDFWDYRGKWNSIMEPSQVPALRFSLSVFVFGWKPSDQRDIGSSPERIFPDKENREACPELQQCENTAAAECDIIFIQIINKGPIYTIPIPAQNERDIWMISCILKYE